MHVIVCDVLTSYTQNQKLKTCITFKVIMMNNDEIMLLSANVDVQVILL